MEVELKKNGAYWDCYFNGIKIVEASPDPEHDSARALKELGLSGKFTTRHEGMDFAAMTLTVEEGSKWRVNDGRLRPI